MSSTEYYFERPWALYLIIPVVLLVILSFFLFTRRRKTLGKGIALILHCVTLICVVFIIAGFGQITKTNKQETVILVDCSDSTLAVREKILSSEKQLKELFKDEQPLLTLAFGGGEIFEVREEGEGRFDAIKLPADMTDIGAALDYAAQLLPDDHAKRIILLSDGKETDGDAINSARTLRGQGVRIDGVCFDVERSDEAEVQLTSFTSPDRINFGQSVSLVVRIDSNVKTVGTLWITEGETLVASYGLDLEKGGNQFEYTVTPKTAGTHVYTAGIIVPNDLSDKNNDRSLSVNVVEDGKILILADRVSEGTFLRDTLKSTGKTVDIRAALRAPTSIFQLCQYDQLILVNVSVEDLPEKYDALLDEYVSVYGRSLLFYGGNNTFSLGGMRGNGYEELLPVSLDYSDKRSEDTVALMLVLDCSRSMEIYNPDVFYYAKESAVRCLEAMNESDYVGIISFNTSAKLEHEPVLATSANKEELKRAIWDIEIGAGTHYTPALYMAMEQLDTVKADVKHVIFLSDGEPMGDNEYEHCAVIVGQNGISVSTIGLMVGTRYNSEPLQVVAQLANGNYYEVNDETDLPDIMLSEAMEIAKGPYRVGEFSVQIPKLSSVTRGLEEEHIPIVKGYIGTTPKKNAEILMTVSDGDPLIARWTYGKGTVSAFMSDAGNRWTEEWAVNPLYRTIFERITSTVYERQADQSSLLTDLRQLGKTVRLTVETAKSGGRLELKVNNGAMSVLCELTRTGENLYFVDILPEDIGAYLFKLTLKDENEVILDEKDVVYSVSYSPEYDTFSPGGRALFSDVCALTGGICLDDGEDLTELSSVKMGTITYKTSFSLYFALAAAALFFLEILLCALKWKDIKKIFKKPIAISKNV